MESSQKEFHNFWQTDGAIPCHSGPRLTELNWYDPDSEENWRKNPRGFLPDSVTYKFNRYGFRINQKDWDLSAPKKIFTLGCSQTFGVGINVNNIWPELLAKRLNSELFNLGVSGGSSDSVARYFYLFLQAVRPEQVFILWPDPNRYEDYEDYLVVDDHLASKENVTINHPRYRSAWAFTPEILKTNQLKNNYYKNRVLVESLAKNYGVELYQLTWEEEFNVFLKQGIEIYEGSRDKVHPGIPFHNYITNRFMQLLC